MQNYEWEPGPVWQVIAGTILVIVMLGGAMLVSNNNEPNLTPELAALATLFGANNQLSSNCEQVGQAQNFATQ